MQIRNITETSKCSNLLIPVPFVEPLVLMSVTLPFAVVTVVTVVFVQPGVIVVAWAKGGAKSIARVEPIAKNEIEGWVIKRDFVLPFP